MTKEFVAVEKEVCEQLQLLNLDSNWGSYNTTERRRELAIQTRSIRR